MDSIASTTSFCARHPDALATFTCTRCGSFACEGCRSALGSDVCATCASRYGAVSFEPGSMISDAFSVALKSVPVLLPLALVMAALALPAGLMQKPATPGQAPDIDVLFRQLIPSIITGCIGMLISPLLYSVYIAVLDRIAAGEGPSLGAAFSLAARRYLPALGQFALLSIPLVLGFACCIAPGAAMMVALLFAFPALVLDGYGPIASIERSIELIRPRFWQAVAATLAVGVAYLAAVFAGSFATVLVVPAPLMVRAPVLLTVSVGTNLALLPIVALTVVAYRRVRGVATAGV